MPASEVGNWGSNPYIHSNICFVGKQDTIYQFPHDISGTNFM